MLSTIYSFFKRQPLLASLTSGILLGIAWPPLPFAPLLLIALVPLFIAIHNTKSWLAILYAYISMAIWFAITMYWIGNVNAGIMDVVIILSGFLVAPLFSCIPFYVFYWVRKRISNAVLVWLMLPVFWSAYELLMSTWELSYNWLVLGLGFSKWPLLIQFYEYVGTSGGSLLIVLFNVVLFLLIENHFKDSNTKPFVKSLIGITTIVVLLNILTNCLSSEKQKGEATIALVQANYSAYDTLTEQSLDKQIDLLDSLLASNIKTEIDLIVCSEGYLRGYGNNDIFINNIEQTAVAKKLLRLAKKYDAPILTGMICFQFFQTKPKDSYSANPLQNGGFYEVYNAALFVTPKGKIQVQTKNKLVPFMERVPLLNLLSIMEGMHLSLNQSSASYGRIDKHKVFRYKKLKIAPVICIETVYPEYVRQFAKKRANLLAVIANEGWTGKTSGYLQNASYASTLAIQLRKPLVRAANTGVTLFCNNKGEAKNQTKWMERTVVIDKLILSKSKTLYSMLGDWIGKISALLTIILLFFLIIKRKFSSRN